MGCTQSKGTSNGGQYGDGVFQVVNIDNEGNKTKKGHIELRDTEIVFQSADSEPIVWDLRYLRRYGYDSNLFSFESGRRSATGHGIFAFKCREAELLFNMLQERIQRLGEEDQRLLMGAGRGAARSVSGSGTMSPLGPAANSLNGLQRDSELVNPHHVNIALNNGHYINREAVQNHENQLHLTATEPVTIGGGNGASRGSSTPRTSGGRATTVGGLSNNLAFNIANGSQGHYAIPKWHYGEATQAELNYVNMPAGSRPAEVVYLNDPQVTSSAMQPAAAAGGDDPVLNYVQVDVQQSNGTALQQRQTATGSCSAADGAGEGACAAVPKSSGWQQQDEAAAAAVEAANGCGYTSIDFKRTEALNNSRSAVATDDGPRKTRHNSNIEDRAWVDGVRPVGTKP